MTNKELQELLKEYPDNANILFRSGDDAIGVVYQHPTLDLTISSSINEAHPKELVKELIL